MTDKNSSQERPASAKPRRNIFVRIAKWVAVAVIVVLLLILLSAGAAVWILTPDRLTPLTNSLASQQLNATVEAQRVELTFWKSFPRLKVEVDSLVIVSHSLKGLDAQQRRSIPQDADTLLTLGGLRGGLDLLSLAVANIRLYDVDLLRPSLNVVQVDSLTSNYDIFPPSEEKEKEPVTVPDISINRFAILGGFPIRYTSVADSISANLRLTTAVLDGEENPVYTLDFEGNTSGRLPDIAIPRLTFGLNGNIAWAAAEPQKLAVEDMTLSVEKVALTFDADVQLLDTLAINALTVTGRDIAVADAIALIPEDMRGELAKVTTDLKLSLKAALMDRYVPSLDVLPRVAVELTMPRGSLAYDRLQLNGLSADVDAILTPADFDLSKINVRDFRAEGNAIDFSVKANVTRPISDPNVDGTFNGSIDFSRLPQSLTSLIPYTLTGTLDGDASFKFRVSQLSPKHFHKMRLDGNLHLRNFRATALDGSGTIYTRNADFKLGTSNSVTVNGMSVDSLLTASLDIDTCAAAIPGVEFTAAGMKAGFGARNVAATFDTTKINPLGANIRARRLMLKTDSDSMRLKISDAMIRATLQRYNSNSRAPLLKLALETGALRFSDPINHMSLRDASVDLTLHPKGRPKMSKRMQAVYDSIAAVYPTLTADSIMSIARKHHRARFAMRQESKTERLDFEIDNSIRSWLRLWQAEGSIKARRARMFTPYFPLRNRVTDLNMTFSTDSINIHDTRYRMGQSDFLINGSISNISRALTSRRGAPLIMNLDIKSDTININEITRALMMGSDFAERIAAGQANMSHSDNEDAIEASINKQVDTTARGPILIPTNLTATLNVRARTMKYGDIFFQRFTGQIEAQDGAIHLKRLGAFTPMGSFGMTALYSAPTADSINFAGGLVIRRLDLKQFLRMIPEIDSIIPMLRSMEGIITAECALSTQLDSLMDFKFHTLHMALKLSGDSLVLLDNDTFTKLSKWLMFKNKNRNMIDSMEVEMVIRNSMLQLYPFMVSLDRYRFGISGSNDAALNLNYHIAVLKSPVPFKFGVNIKGTPDHLKIRLGRAHFNENQVASSRSLTDTVRINLINEIQNVFKFGLSNSRNRKLTLLEPKVTKQEFEISDTISHADSVFFIRQGVIPRPKGWVDPDSVVTDTPKKKKRRFF